MIPVFSIFPGHPSQLFILVLLSYLYVPWLRDLNMMVADGHLNFCVVAWDIFGG